MYEPTISIIIPTYNIVDAGRVDDFNILIGLLDRQTYSNVEYLVMDSASEDDTLSLLKDYKNAGFINFFSERDRGKFEAYNKGILRAKGKYVAFISCDDFYHDITGLEDVVKVMEAENADYCYFPSYCRHPEGFAFLFVPSIFNIFQVPPFPRQALVVKKSVMDELKGFDETFKLLSDYDLMIRLFMNGYHGVYFEGNIVTYKLGEQVTKQTIQADAELSHIFHKNYRSLYPLKDEVLERMVKFGEIPRELLDVLVKKFPEADHDLFFERYELMYNSRVSAMKNRKQNTPPPAQQEQV